jgi:hypothetical protein
MTLHLIIIKGTDSSRTQSKCLSREIQAVANSASFKMAL